MNDEMASRPALVDADEIAQDRLAAQLAYDRGAATLTVDGIDYQLTIGRNNPLDWRVTDPTGVLIGGIRNCGASGWAAYDREFSMIPGWVDTRAEAIRAVVTAFRASESERG